MDLKNARQSVLIKASLSIFAPLLLLASCSTVSTLPDGKYYEIDTMLFKEKGAVEKAEKPGCEVSSSAVEWVLLKGGCKDGRASGEGVAVSIDAKRTYIGSLSNGRFHGKGAYDWGDGTRYTGEWNNGLRDGKGRYWLFREGKFVSVYEGNFKAGEISGHGTSTWSDGDKYVGWWEDGYFQGLGTYTTAEGRKYVGEFSLGKYNGKGTITWPNGDKYTGEFSDGKFHGYGTYIYAKGEKYSGWWNNGSSPAGKLTKSDGTVITGSWEEILNRKFPSDHSARNELRIYPLNA